MALPDALTTVIVICGPYTDAKGVPYTGHIDFTPNTPLVWSANGHVIMDSAARAQLDATGKAIVVLPATDAAGLTATDFAYKVDYSLRTPQGRLDPPRTPFFLQLPGSVPSVALELLIPLSGSGGTIIAVGVVHSVAGLSGSITAGELFSALGLSSAALRSTTDFEPSGSVAVGMAIESARAQTAETAETARAMAAEAARVQMNRQIVAGTGLTGGGDLSADRTLQVTFGTTSTTAARGDDPRITNALQPGMPASGDLSGSLPSPTVAKINGVAITGAPTAGQTLVASGSTSAFWGAPVLPTVVDGGTPSSTGTSGKIMLVHRHGTAAEWASANPILADGELGVERDTSRLKVGDGATSWNSLTYFSNDSAGLWAPVGVVPTAYQQYMQTIAINNSALATLATETGYTYVILDNAGRMALGIKLDGTVVARLANPVNSITRSQLDTDAAAHLLSDLPDGSAAAYAVTDSSGRAAIQVLLDGSVNIPKLSLPSGSITRSLLASDITLMGNIADEAGYVYAIMDTANRAALRIASDGTVDIPKFKLADGSVSQVKLGSDVTLPQTLAAESGYAYAITDNAGRLSFGIRTDGTLVGQFSSAETTATPSMGGNTLAEVFTASSSGTQQIRATDLTTGNVVILTTDGDNRDPRPTPDGTKVLFRRKAPGTTTYIASYAPSTGGKPYPISPAAGAFSMWSDSMGNTGSPTLWQALGNLVGSSVYNGGVGGENPAQIVARQGGRPVGLTLTGNSIPADLTPVNISGWDLDEAGNLPSYQGPQSFTGTLAGVRGSINRVGVTGPPYVEQSSTTWNFTRATAGTSTTSCPPGTPFYMDISPAHEADCQIIWSGKNGGTDAAHFVKVRAHVAEMVAFLKTLSKRYLILSVCNSKGQPTGSDPYNQYIAHNTQLASIYGDRYIDVRTYLVNNGLADAGLTPTSQDLIDIGEDVIPDSLRSDATHLNGTGVQVVARQVYARLVLKGWV